MYALHEVFYLTILFLFQGILEVDNFGLDLDIWRWSSMGIGSLVMGVMRNIVEGGRGTPTVMPVARVCPSQVMFFPILPALLVMLQAPGPRALRVVP